MSKSRKIEVSSTKGRWWEVGKPERVLLGEISFGTCAGADLKLFGSFQPLASGDLASQKPERLTIHGQTVKGELITLFNCITSGATFHIGNGGGATSSLQSCFGVVGAHFDNPEQMVFKMVEVKFNTLFDWCATSGVSIIPGEGHGRFDLHFKCPDTIRLGRLATGVGSVEFTAILQPKWGDYEILEDCSFIVACDEQTPFSKIEDDIKILQLLLSLATQKPTYAIKISGKADDSKTAKDLMIIRKLSLVDADLEPVHAFEMLFTLADVSNCLDSFISNFITKHNCLSPCLDLYFSTIYDQTLPPRVNVLLLSQALEGFHRIVHGGRYLNDETYGSKVLPALLGALPAELDSSFRSSLKAKLKYLNEYSLRKRLQFLAKQQNNRLGQFLGDPVHFGSRIADLRNTLTHPSETAESTSSDYKEHWSSCCQMSLLFETCLLTELGFSNEQIDTMVLNRSASARRVHFSKL